MLCHLYRSDHLSAMVIQEYRSLINFVVVAVFINCSISSQYHYRSHPCYNLGKNLTSNIILVRQYIKIRGSSRVYTDLYINR